MRILIFTEGTILMHSSGKGHSREKIVQQALEDGESIHNFTTYIPIGSAVEKLTQWEKQGAEICYLTSRTTPDELAAINNVLHRHRFPSGRLFHRLREEHYPGVAERVKPDILIEDDCESIGGKKEMICPFLNKKSGIRVIVVKEFEGIGHLPDSLEEL